MGNNVSLAAQIPEPHVRIYRNILQIQSPQTRLQMLETVLSGPEYVASVKQAGIYGPVLSYISAIRRGDPALLPGEQSRPAQQQVQQYSDGGQGRPQNVFTSPGRQGQVIHHSGDPGAHTKAITFFSQCLQILGLEEEVALNEEALKAAYKKASLRAHPDKGGSEKAFDEVTRAYAYLGEILRRVRGGRSEMVNVTEESPARLAAAREDKSEAWKLNEPVKLNPKSLNMDVFNKVFEETRLPDPDGDGYGDWLKDPSSGATAPGNKFNGKFNRSVFNEAFEGEIKSRAMNQSSRAVAMRQPQALVMAPAMGIELGRERPEDFTGANLSGLKYTDLRKAYTEESTFSHQVSDVQVSNKSFDAAASERKAAPRPLSAEELESVQEGERYMAQRQAQQAARISQEDRRISEHFERMKRYVLTDK